MSVETKPNKLVKGLVLDTFHTDVDNTVATYALNAQLEDQEGNHFHYGSEVGTTYIKEIPTGHVVVGHINMERNETVLFTTDGTNSTIGILSRNDNMAYHYEIKVDDTKQEKKLNFKKEGYVRGVYRLLNGCDKVIYFVDGVNKDRRVNINQLDSYKIADTQSVASGIIFDDSLRATIFALSTASGNIQLIRLMSASPEATANVLASLSSGAELTKLLTASANGIGTAFANLMRTANMISSVEATGTTTSNVDIVRLLQGNISAIGSVNAILESIQQGIVEIDVTLSGVASSTAILLRAALLESSLTTEASTIVEAILTRVINAQSQATANTSATAQITVPINATANATATTAANAILSYAVNATANAMAETSATAQLSQVINASLNATATSSVEALIGLVLISTTTANGSISTANLFINRLLTSSVTAQGTTTAEALIAKLLQSSVTGQANTTSNAVVSKLASSSVNAQANITANSLVSKLLASTVNGVGNVTANLQLADLLSLTVNGTATTEAVLEAISSMFSINRGLRFSSSRSTFLSRTPTVAGNRKTWTWSGWFKLSSFASYQFFSNANAGNTQGFYAEVNSSGNLYFYDYNNAFVWRLVSNAVFTDISAWYHLTFVFDTTQSIDSNRARIYINGQQITSFSIASYPTQNYDSYWNNNISSSIGRAGVLNSAYFNGYMAEVNFIDGQALTPTSFGELDLNLGTWIPKAYTGTYGTNGFRLNFNDVSGITATTLGKDSSVNGNNWTPNNFSVTSGVNYDGMTDSPTNTSETIGNYTTLNPLAIGGGTISNANLTYARTSDPSGNTAGKVLTTIAANSGKWYFEYVIASSSSSIALGVTTNIQGTTNTIGGTNFVGNQSYEYCWRAQGQTINNGSFVNYGSSATNTDIVMVAFDVSDGKIWWGKNGTWFNSSNPATGTSPAFSGLSGTMMPILGIGTASSGFAADGSVNFGQRPFAYTIPTGFKTLNTFNLPTPTIGATTATQANKFMDISLYTGTGVAQSIFNSGFKPDLVWIKNRTGTAANHAIYDINRGVTKQLSSSSDALEVTNASGLTSFDNTGFSIGTLADINTNGNNYIAWQWRADGTPLTLIAGNTISSSVSVNSVSKFSIITYTGNGTAGATIAHGLGVVPRMVMIKSRTGAVSNWAVYHGSLGNTSSLFLNTNGVSLASNTYWNNTNPTTNLISLGTSDLVNANARNYVAYAWAEIDGFSKFNSYVGNGNVDGTFVYTGFRPKFILIKSSSAATTNWAMYNSIVNTSNPVINELLANSSAIENTTGTDLDFLSNGFKLRSTNADINTSAATYIYAAFGEFPLKYANAALTERVRETVTVDYLVVAGGGLGTGGVSGTKYPSGGGGGEVKLGQILFTKNTLYTITVGGSGTNSSISDVIVSTKGGNGITGGIGGTSGNGNIGGQSNGLSSGGGGGNGSVGTNAPNGSVGGNGGSGTQSSIQTGSNIGYGGGGAGMGSSSFGSATDGGGTGPYGTLSAPNRGGGAGADQAGGSGVVIIRTSDSIADPITLSGGTKTTYTGYKVYTFNGSGSITF